MRTRDITTDKELQQVLWACYEYSRREPLPVAERAVCYAWVKAPYQTRFGRSFHPSSLKALVALGLLEPDDTSRGGHRRYYRLVDPGRVRDLLAKWELVKGDTPQAQP